MSYDDFARDWSIKVSFHADRETAERIREALVTTLEAVTEPTPERASALFRLGALYVATAADLARASA